MDGPKMAGWEGISVTSWIASVSIVLLLFLAACDGGGTEPPGEDGPEPDRITLDPSVTHQEMLGFGGALTWHCDRITRSSKKDDIAQLLFEDLGTDVLRLKNWYYPVDYPDDKTADEMEVSWFKPHFDATNELYDLAKQHNPDIDVLLSSWGPPSSLKSNGSLYEGTLEKNADGTFAYDAFADYWIDILDHISFAPEYLSIQNEPAFVTPDWETSEWRPNETDQFPGYQTALDEVYQRLQSRSDAPVFIGPESANLGNSAFGNTFGAFAEVLRDKEYVGMYGYHLYNFDENTSISETTPDLRMVGDDFGDKPNIMTEYSGMSWMRTARLINHVVVEADASGYIYWEMMWDENEPNAMVQVDQSGNYEITPFYYVIKHFAKHVDEGYRRIEVSSEDGALHVSGYVSPSGDQLTLVIVNPFDSTKEIAVEVADQSIRGLGGKQSTASEFYRDMGSLASDASFSIPSRSITTVVIDV